jgi:hypothetical protein
MYTVGDKFLSLATFPTPLVSHWSLPLKESQFLSGGAGGVKTCVSIAALFKWSETLTLAHINEYMGLFSGTARLYLPGIMQHTTSFQCYGL